jgi:hypothetical protein
MIQAALLAVKVTKSKAENSMFPVGIKSIVMAKHQAIPDTWVILNILLQDFAEGLQFVPLDY